MKSPIKIYNDPSDPRKQMLIEGASMSVDELYKSFFMMQKRLRAMSGNDKPTDRAIKIKLYGGQ
ncbi:MAG: hypothetical protein NW207_11770 [Cytophagales bacterium]|nr:hypothetical protein [Cytophagales bacterium]